MTTADFRIRVSYAKRMKEAGNLTLDEIASGCGVSRQAIFQLFNGVITSETLLTKAEAAIERIAGRRLGEFSVLLHKKDLSTHTSGGAVFLDTLRQTLADAGVGLDTTDEAVTNAR